jgi:hypothetical protein
MFDKRLIDYKLRLAPGNDSPDPSGLARSDRIHAVLSGFPVGSPDESGRYEPAG